MADKKVIKLEGAVGSAKTDAPPPPLPQVIQLETQALLNTFPEEIWVKVLDNVTRGNDLENLLEASPFFKSRVHDRRVVYLFKKVFPILYPTLEAELWKDYIYWFQSDEQKRIEKELELKTQGYNLLCTCCGRFRNFRIFSGLLDIRLVCTAWCDGVDNFCENLEFRFKMVDIDVTEPEEVKQTARSMIEESECFEVEFGKVKRVRTFMNHFKGSHGNDKDRNPFLGRSISLKWRLDKPVYKFDMKSTDKVEGKKGESSQDKQDSGNDGDLKAPSSGSGNDSDEWLDIASDSDDYDPEGNRLFDPEVAKRYNNQVLLKKYGHHVWYCKIDIYDNAIPSPDSCAWLIQMLKLMPNLKVLRIDCSYMPRVWKYYYGYYEDAWMERCLNGVEFPKLNNLEYLSGRHLPKTFVVQIIKQNPNLKQLELLGYSERPMYGYGILSLIGDSLKRLGLSVCSDKDCVELQKIQVDWPLLETLHVEAANLGKISREDISSWVKNKFGESCKLSINWVSRSTLLARRIVKMRF